MNTIKLKSDASLRKRLMVPDSFRHPAKMPLGLVLEIAARYGLKPGDWVLDPMAGCGTTMVLALQGINVCLVELEQHFVEPARDSWAKMRQNPMLGCTLGEVMIIRADARALPLPDGDSIRAVLTSPPYEAPVSDNKEGPGQTSMPGGWKAGTVDKHGGYTRPVDAVVSSPPFQDQEATKAGKFADPVKAAQIQAANYRSGKSKGHPASAEAILRAMDRVQSYAPGNAENIGNQRGQVYWDSMALVYRECHRVLRPGGLVVLVLKGFTRDGQYVDLPAMTEELVTSLGFTKVGEWRRELWSLSFWRILQKRRNPAAFDERLTYESVLAFRKPGDDGPEAQAVISSPP